MQHVQGSTQPATIWTIGHSNRSSEEFMALLDSVPIEQVIDIRRFPGSRRQPQFASEVLADALAKQNIAYHHLPELGGRRGKPASDSPNSGWRVAQFAAYADHLQSEEFARGLEALMLIADTHRSAMMCSEAVPWRCHRRLVADALTVRGWEVRDIMAKNKTTRHDLTDFANVQGGVLTYPSDNSEG